ncbi:hypothetical protein B0T18DRAFT_390686 [Schizothecium vesticola]|uniref:PIN domain-like protein n=1 Tax=Schizothecium vesticola TaxID=314040 RepID=A0AA40EVH5_9PEZI|nr:hypothetical protein B0T18DRAFT_390686 [Schizothecium vesticola]
MGVNGLWTVVQPCARPTNLAQLNRKRLAVDASIWIYQFLKAVRDKEGNALRNSHVVGFFRRICKLLWHGILPVFVFDGGAPALKRATLQGRRQRREGRRDDAARTAGKLLAVQMQRLAEEEEEKRRRPRADRDDEQEALPAMDQMVYADELGMSNQERQKSRKFHKQDAYHLPEMPTSLENMGKPEDPRIMSVEELEEYARQFHNGEDINLYDFSKIDFDGEFFKSLPAADRYNILNAARLRSRLRMGLSKQQLDEMFPDRMAFSRFQIERVKERNHLTQRLMAELGMTGLDLTIQGAGSRVAGERNREYILVRNEGAEGGWALGVVTRDKDVGKFHKPIDVDALEFQYQAKEEEEEFEDEDFEDVPIPGVNRLPKLDGTTSQQDADLNMDDALFVDNGNNETLSGDDDLFGDEEEDLNRAIAMSLETQHGPRLQQEEEDLEEDLEDVQAPEWTQRAVEAPRPIVSTSGRMVAHIVNNRSNAAVPRRQESDSDSDSDMDLQSALAAARRKKAPVSRPVQNTVQRAAEKAPVRPNVQNAFGGPLPFEKLEWKSFISKPTQPVAEKPAAGFEGGGIAGLELDSDDDAGGFVRERGTPKKASAQEVCQQLQDAPLPLPPWLQNTSDIRDEIRKQRKLQQEMNAEDEELAMEEQISLLRRREEEIVEIESSSGDDSDIEILDAPPPLPPKQASAKNLGASLSFVSDEIMEENQDQPTAKSTPVATTPQRPAARPPSPNDLEDELEDVVAPVAPPMMSRPTAAEAAEAAEIEAELFGDITPPAGSVNGDASGNPSAAAPQEFDDFSDSEELLVQLAEEAEEHARFASQLNNKSQQENQKAYEAELKALRNQQKKDRRDADEVSQIMVTECQALLRLFGIPYITAPMEAEAQCAELVRLKLVDGIVTDDSDTFLFGGTRVYKNMFNSNKYVECYVLHDLDSELSLSRDRLIALAQLLGSDYTEGLPGVGPVTALEILSEFPGADGLPAFRDWWLDVDSTRDAFVWGAPDLDGLRGFLTSTVGWSQERTDEVLVPVIRDMNRRALEGTQANITRYFEGSVGAGARAGAAPGRGGSKRMANAVSRLRGKKASAGLSMEMPVAFLEPKVAKKKRKAKGAVVAEGEEDEAEEEADGGTSARGRGKAKAARGKRSKA